MSWLLSAQGKFGCNYYPVLFLFFFWNVLSLKCSFLREMYDNEFHGIICHLEKEYKVHFQLTERWPLLSRSWKGRQNHIHFLSLESVFTWVSRRMESSLWTMINVHVGKIGGKAKAFLFLFVCFLWLLLFFYLIS